MPYYRWSGVLLDTTLLSGYSFAHNVVQLDTILIKRGIALVSCKPARKWYVHGISSNSVVSFLEHLQMLLASGVHVWQALVVISEQTPDERLAEIIYNMSRMVNEGQSLHEAFAHYPQLFNEQLVHIAYIGAQSGELSVALQALCIYLQQTEQFKKRLRQLLLLPLCTVVAFIIMLLFVLFVVLPRYVSLFAAMGKEVPHMTAWLLHFNRFIFSYYAIGILFIALTCIVVLNKIKAISSVRLLLDQFLLQIPYAGSFVQKITAMHFFQAVSLLLQGKMLLVPALQIAQQSVTNLYINAQLEEMIEEVKNGMPLSEAMQHQCRSFFKQDIVLLITIGEQTATVTDMVQRITAIYQKQIEHLLGRYLLLLQPMLMLILGILVAALISAVYMPLFNLADLV